MKSVTACAYFNSQPREGGWNNRITSRLKSRTFQLTAARRRLGYVKDIQAARRAYFNSQPREGGWLAV